MILAAYSTQAIFLAKADAPIMRQMDFPPQKDRERMSFALNENYSQEWIQIIRTEVCFHMEKAIPV